MTAIQDGDIVELKHPEGHHSIIGINNTPAPTRRVNVSEILAYQNCPSYWASAYHYKRSLRGTKRTALDIGTAFHKSWEQAMRHYKQQAPHKPGLADVDQWVNSLQLTYTMELEQRGIPVLTKDLTTLKGLGTWAAWWWGQDANPPFDEVVEVEWTGERPLGTIEGVDVVLFGRLDAVVRRNDDLRPLKHWQVKTSGPQHLDLKIAKVKRSLHESAYSYIAEGHWGPELWGGTHHFLVLKVGLRKKDDSGVLLDRNPAETIVETDLVISQAIRSQRLADIKEVVRNIIIEERNLGPARGSLYPLPVEQREHYCGGAYGSSRCQYMATCDGEVPLTDVAYEDANPLERYADAEDDE